MPLPDPIAAAQALSWGVGLAAAVAAYPTWYGSARLSDAASRRWGDGVRIAVAAFALSTFGFMPIGVVMMSVIGLGADAASALRPAPRCVIERFKPDGTSAGVMFLDGSCPPSARP